MSNHVGRFLWFDLNTTDVAAAKAFYTAVVGWTLTPFNADYEMLTGDAPVGGVNALSADAKAMGAPPHWLAWIGVEDTDASVEAVTALGGKIYAPAFDMPTVGRCAVVADPEGAVFGLFQPAQVNGDPDAEKGPRDFGWHELMAADYTAAFGFYAELFGWTQTESMDMGEAGTYQMFGAGKGSLGGMMNRTKEMPVSAWLQYINVADLDGALERVIAHGGQVVNGPMQVPGGTRVAQCVDPQGAAFALHG